MATQNESKYREVQGLARGLAVLRALNAMPGGIGGVSELARLTKLHRTTVKRLLETLKVARLVHDRDVGQGYALGFEVRRLSEGYVGTRWIDEVAAPVMQRRVRELSWPSDLATPDSGFMIVRESTHRLSFLSQHRATIGIRHPILVTALGRAWLAWCTPAEREATLELLRARNDEVGEQARDRAYVRKVLRETTKRGYAVNRGEWKAEPNVAAIAFPICVDGYAVAAINLALQRNHPSDSKIASRYAPLLKDLAAEISTGASALATSPWSVG